MDTDKNDTNTTYSKKPRAGAPKIPWQRNNDKVSGWRFPLMCRTPPKIPAKEMGSNKFWIKRY